jgi:hypothetical protein
MTDVLERPTEATPQLAVLSLEMPPKELIGSLADLDKKVALDVRGMLIGAAALRHQEAIATYKRTGGPVKIPEAVMSPILHGSEGQSVLAAQRKKAGLRTAVHPDVPGMRLLVSL